MVVSAAERPGVPRAGLLNWSNRSLAEQFIIVGSAVLVMGMVVIGLWVTGQIRDGVTRNTAVSTALYMDSMVAPLVQELAQSDRLSPGPQAELDSVLQESPLGRRLVSFKIWKDGGLVAYSSRPSIVGRTFEMTPNLRAAWSGAVTAEFDTLVDEEDALERAAQVPLLEIYSPIRESRTGRIIAVAEFYETASDLSDNLFWANLKSWAVVATVTLAMMALLSGIVIRGSRTIAAQRLALERRVEALSVLLRQNEDLRLRVQGASRRAAELNERYLRRIAAELHDGPAQLLALASLRLDVLERAVRTAGAATDTEQEVDGIRRSLAEALLDLRGICKGLVLPELERMDLDRLLRSVAEAHERRTASKVRLDLALPSLRVPQAVKICVYRFVQEGLSNAFKHAGGEGQEVRAAVAERQLVVSVADSGPGLADRIEGDGLGLAGLQERIESLGGRFEVHGERDRGTTLTLRLPLEGNSADA